jgi:hypothetical protein
MEELIHLMKVQYMNTFQGTHYICKLVCICINNAVVSKNYSELYWNNKIAYFLWCLWLSIPMKKEGTRVGENEKTGEVINVKR